MASNRRWWNISFLWSTSLVDRWVNFSLAFLTRPIYLWIVSADEWNMNSFVQRLDQKHSGESSIDHDRVSQSKIERASRWGCCCFFASRVIRTNDISQKRKTGFRSFAQMHISVEATIECDSRPINSCASLHFQFFAWFCLAHLSLCLTFCHRIIVQSTDNFDNNRLISMIILQLVNSAVFFSVFLHSVTSFDLCRIHHFAWFSWFRLRLTTFLSSFCHMESDNDWTLFTAAASAFKSMKMQFFFFGRNSMNQMDSTDCFDVSPNAVIIIFVFFLLGINFNTTFCQLKIVDNVFFLFFWMNFEFIFRLMP